ncbi:DeoR/GlpR family DNA-binding transcription regulator [Chengkuizengella axinellae]|uniref:DeoR/GlpR family DNA-binding transcription regulator n=1 Tax=Chengkuizengella axinellae TaxID=3064388 RepID=A0ABT9ITF7_9BACL|nr:DeoR/GlpR family DNA-binding transcription regulator [Chengkuizengella sp. 2205SS18-9]MDP5272618.1 DeoR/GlpR family DNA-binding transcription regulator [Chengkuizengella sp. 2205SS18-9]
MLAGERQQKILDLIQTNGSVKVSQISTMFQVTEKTIREDLEKLEKRQLLKRIHGGAISIHKQINILTEEQSINNMLSEKEAIAEAALKHIRPNDIIALDAGSTSLEIAKKLEIFPLTVVTNDLMIIRELCLRDEIRLVVPGGYKQSNMLIHNDNTEWIEQLNIHKLFLTTSGIHLEFGLSIFNKSLIPLKKALLKASKEVICIADHRKFNKGALFTFAALEEVNLFITDEGVQPSVHKELLFNQKLEIATTT